MRNDVNVLFITNIPSPYNVDYLNELGKFCNVVAVFERKTSSERDSSWEMFNAESFKCFFLSGKKIKTDMSISFDVVTYLRRYKNYKIIIANMSSPTGIIAISYCKRHKLPFYLQSEGGLAGNGKGFREKFKKKLMSGATGYLSGMKSDLDYFLSYGGTKDTIKSYPFTSYFQSEILDRVPTINEKSKACDELKLIGKKKVLYVGSIINKKGIDILLKSFASMKDDVHLYLVGGCPNEEHIRLIQELNLDRQNIHFIEFANKKTVRQYYLACDLFVLPTRKDTWGLVINEAMSHGLPVITTTACVAGLELIQNGVNGFLVKSEDSEELHDRITEVLNNEELALTMSYNNIEKIQEYNLENMASRIFEAITEDE